MFIPRTFDVILRDSDVESRRFDRGFDDFDITSVIFVTTL